MGEWIRMMDMRPEARQPVYAFDGRDVSACEYFDAKGDEYGTFCDANGCHYRASHWMPREIPPLPEPPKPLVSKDEALQATIAAIEASALVPNPTLIEHGASFDGPAFVGILREALESRR